VDIEYRNGLREEGKARYGGGKCELLRIGAMDDIHIAVGHPHRGGTRGRGG
jgi:hypothetical protein